MKKLLSVANSAEAHLLVEALRQESIVASVQGEWGSLEGPSVWVENDTDAERARVLVAEMMAKQGPASNAAPAPGRLWVFVCGLLLGLILGTLIAGRLPKSRDTITPQTWDGNGDGAPDNWARYDSAGRLIESSTDLNLDGTPDYWVTYNPPGVLSMIRYDEDFDGREDLWEVYQKGMRVSYTADNDRNGVVDEWGRFENARQVERNWSFSNDRVADRRTFYRAGRKMSEEYDRDRDGVFEERVLFDEFERVVSSR